VGEGVLTGHAADTKKRLKFLPALYLQTIDFILKLVSAEVLPLSFALKHLALANRLNGALIDKRFFTNLLTNQSSKQPRSVARKEAHA
jgi:hypothetical protein